MKTKRTIAAANQDAPCLDTRRDGYELPALDVVESNSRSPFPAMAPWGVASRELSLARSTTLKFNPVIPPAVFQNSH